MKKLAIVAVMAIAAAAFTACGNGTPKASLKSDLDSLSYAYGMAQTSGLKDYLVGRMGVDTAYIDQFIKGVNAGVNAGDDKAKAAYYAGIQIGQQINNQVLSSINYQLFGNDSTKTISMKNFMAAFLTGVANKKGLMNIEQAQMVFQAKMEKVREKAMEDQYGANREAGEKYIAEYAKKEDVKKLEGGVLYRVLKVGTGELPADTSRVKVNYEGKTIDGKVFDSSYERKEPTVFPANRVIPGWTEALVHMPVGSKWEVVIPQDKAYGAREQGQIKPFSALIFTIELLGIEK